MRIHITTAAAGFLLLAGAGAVAAQDVVIEPEQETVIKEYVHKQPLASVKIPGVELSIGSTIPDTVELHEVPNVKYRYVVVDNQTVIVDTGEKKPDGPSPAAVGGHNPALFCYHTLTEPSAHVRVSGSGFVS